MAEDDDLHAGYDATIHGKVNKTVTIPPSIRAHSELTSHSAQERAHA